MFQYHTGLDSAAAEPSFTLQGQPQGDTGMCDSVSTFKYALGSGYDSSISRQEFDGSDAAGQDGDTILIDEGPGPSVDESNNAGKSNTSYTPPLIVSSPLVGSVPRDDDDEDVMPTLVTPAAKSAPKIIKSSVAQSKTELVKGPAGISYLPAHHAKSSEPQSEISVNNMSVSRPAPDPEPKFYPPPPRATGSPNDKYRQVPRSGGAVRNPNHPPFQYQYGGLDRQLVGGALPSAYNQQQQYPYPYPFLQQAVGQSQYNSPAGDFNQSGKFFNPALRPGFQHRQPFDQQSYLGGGYKGRARGKYDVRKARGYDKNNESNRYSNRNQYQNGSRPGGPRTSPTFPLDPALEVNYRNYSRQDNYYGDQSQYPYQNNGQWQNQNQYAAAPQFGYNIGNGNGDGNGGENENSYHHAFPAPPVFNGNANYYSPSAFAAQEQKLIPSFSPEIGRMAPPQMIAPPAQQDQRQPFAPSPFAVPFTPRSTEAHNEVVPHGQGQGPGLDYATGDKVGAFQQQPQVHGMLPLTPGPFASAMPMPMPAGADLVSQAPVLYSYERPKPVVSMPRLGEFSPPKARKTGRQAKRILEKVLAGTGAEMTGGIDAANFDINALDADESYEDAAGSAAADTEVDELDDGDGEYNPKNEGNRKKKKPKKPKNKRGAGAGKKDEKKTGDGEGDGQRETDATTTAPAKPEPEDQVKVRVEEDEKMAQG